MKQCINHMWLFLGPKTLSSRVEMGQYAQVKGFPNHTCFLVLLSYSPILLFSSDLFESDIIELRRPCNCNRPCHDCHASPSPRRLPLIFPLLRSCDWQLRTLASLAQSPNSAWCAASQRFLPEQSAHSLHYLHAG